MKKSNGCFEINLADPSRVGLILVSNPCFSKALAAGWTFGAGRVRSSGSPVA
jgi:hypothetical protein